MNNTPSLTLQEFLACLRSLCIYANDNISSLYCPQHFPALLFHPTPIRCSFSSFFLCTALASGFSFTTLLLISYVDIIAFYSWLQTLIMMFASLTFFGLSGE